MSAADMRELPVKGFRWTINLALSAFLTWTALNYFIQPKELIDALRRLGAALRLATFSTVLKPLRQKASRLSALQFQ